MHRAPTTHWEKELVADRVMAGDSPLPTRHPSLYPLRGRPFGSACEGLSSHSELTFLRNSHRFPLQPPQMDRRATRLRRSRRRNRLRPRRQASTSLLIGPTSATLGPESEAVQHPLLLNRGRVGPDSQPASAYGRAHVPSPRRPCRGPQQLYPTQAVAPRRRAPTSGLREEFQQTLRPRRGDPSSRHEALRRAKIP